MGITAFYTCVLALAVLFSGCAELPSLPPTKEPLQQELPPERPLVVATYNVLFSNRRFDLVKKAILDADADIVLLQETSPPLEAHLSEALRTIYPHISFTGFKTQYRGERCGVLSKHRIKEEWAVDAKHGRCGTLFGVIDFHGRLIQFANVHLSPPGVRPAKGVMENIKLFADSDQTHRKELEWILAQFKYPHPTIIAGDFNSFPMAGALTYLKDQGYVDSAASILEFPEDHPTWHMRRPIFQVYYRIDYIFHDRSFRTEESRVLRNESSDHFLVVSKLALDADPEIQKNPAEVP